jgi:recombinational DNA repair protein (RecF pathway)
MTGTHKIELHFTGANAAGTSAACAICGQPFTLTGFDFALSTGEPVCPADAFANAPEVYGLRFRDEVKIWMKIWKRIAAPDATPRDARNANAALKELHAVKEAAAALGAVSNA